MVQNKKLPFEDELNEIDVNAAKVRDITHNLDLNNSDEKEIYYSHLYDNIEEYEGFSSYVYNDLDESTKPITSSSKIEGKATIGYGFNMDRPEARAE